MQHSSRYLGILFAISSSVLFASKAIIIKFAYALSPDVNAINLLVLRMLTALPFFILMIYYLPKTYHQLSVKDWFKLVLAGLLGYYLSSVLDFMGLMYISASLERIILFLYPTLIVLASAVLYRQRISALMMLAITLSYGGTLLVMWHEDVSYTSTSALWLGGGLVFAAGLTYAAYIMMGQSLLKKIGSMQFTAVATSVAVVAMCVHFMLSSAAPIQELINLPVQAYYYGIALGFFVTVLPTVFMMMGVERLGAAKASMLSSAGPIFTLVFAVLLLDEQLNAWQWLGCALNIIGVFLVSLKKS
ncbi:MAG: DMT family transporter [Acinetobacter sp.]|nr:DMT family transporter [Acinetobacter sp.]